MRVPANVPYVFMIESIKVLVWKLLVYQFARSFIQVLHCFRLDRVI